MNYLFFGLAVLFAFIFSMSYSYAFFDGNDKLFWYVAVPSGLLMPICAFLTGLP
jgi:hypothetical protein